MSWPSALQPASPPTLFPWASLSCWFPPLKLVMVQLGKDLATQVHFSMSSDAFGEEKVKLPAYPRCPKHDMNIINGYAQTTLTS